MRRLLLALAFLAFFVPAPAFAAIGGGDLVKLPDDGDLETQHDSAVYYVGGDGKRYVFPNSQTYFTWYADFDAVKIASAEEIAALPIGGNVVYRPGTRLVKITSDPNVYAVEPGGALRWVQSEAIAIALYGPEWNKRIDDIPDAYFFNYSIGDPLAAAVYPDGTVLKRSSDNAYFLIEDRNKRRIVSDAVRASLRIQDAFVITATTDLSEYPNGPDIATAELAITDTSQRNLVAVPSVPTFSVRNPATNFIAVGSEATLLELRIGSLPQATVASIAVRIDATTNNPADAALDDDKGGLVYQNNAQPNLTLLRFVDAAGNEPFGRKSITVDIAQDQSQSFSFTGSFAVPGGTEQVLYLRAQTNALLPNGEGYKATLLVTGTQVTGSGGPMAFQPTSDIAGPTLTTLNANLEVSKASTPGLVTYVRGAKDAEIAGLSFKATTVAPNVIKSLTVQGYVDEEMTAGFLPGSDADNGTETHVRDLVPNVTLWTLGTSSVPAVKIAGPVAVDVFGKATFSGLDHSIPAGTSATLVVRGDISPTVELENQPDRLTFDVTDAATDLSVVDDKGAKVNAVGKLPGGGSSPALYVTVKKNGKASFSWTGGGGAGIAGREVLLGTLTVEAKDDAYDLKVVSFRQPASPAAQSLASIRLEYPSGTSTVSVPGEFLGQVATFTNLPAVVARDASAALKLYGTIRSKDAGAVYDEAIKVKFGNADPLEFVSRSDGTSFDASRLSAVGATTGDFTVPQNQEGTTTVRFSGLAAAKTSDTPIGVLFRESEEPVLKFTLKAEPEGAVRIKQMTFKLSPGDAGTQGANNDALEVWADVNGDFQDDDGIINLVRLVGSSREVLAEGSDGRVQFSIVSGGSEVATPSAHVTINNDYGLVRVTWNDGSELSIAAGTTATFQLELMTSSFDDEKSHALAVELRGNVDFVWTDIPTGAYPPLYGSVVAGLPLSTTGLTVQQ